MPGALAQPAAPLAPAEHHGDHPFHGKYPLLTLEWTP